MRKATELQLYMEHQEGSPYEPFMTDNINELKVSRTYETLKEYGRRTGCPPLIGAAYYNAIKSCIYLIRKGESVNSHGKEGFSALDLAAANGNLELTALLLAAKADIDIMSDSLWYAAHNKHNTVYQTLIEFGANSIQILPRVASHPWEDIFNLAVKSIDPLKIKKPINKERLSQALINASGRSHDCAHNTLRLSMCQKLLDLKADPNYRPFLNYHRRECALLGAVQSGFTEGCQLLLLKKADPNPPGLQHPVLIHANKPSILNLLVKNKADIHKIKKQTDHLNFKITPVQLAAWRGNPLAFMCLVQLKADINAHTSDYDYPLRIALKHYHPKNKGEDFQGVIRVCSVFSRTQKLDCSNDEHTLITHALEQRKQLIALLCCKRFHICSDLFKIIQAFTGVIDILPGVNLIQSHQNAKVLQH